MKIGSLKLPEKPDVYDAAFWEFHNCGDWEGFAKTITDYVTPSSVLDVGCGQGSLLSGFHSINSRITLVGLDSSSTGIGKAKTRGIRVESLDLVSTSESELRQQISRLGHFDLVMCLEVAEHLPVWTGNMLVSVLCDFDRILFSAARPYQGGTGHINEQPFRYWLRKFQRHGFELLPTDQEFRKGLSRLEIASWYKENCHLLARRGTF